MAVGFDFKERAHQALLVMNKGASQCIAMTPFVAKYEINRLKLRIKRVTDFLKQVWFLYLYTNHEAQDAFFRCLYDNVENNPQLDFESKSKKDAVYSQSLGGGSNKNEPNAALGIDGLDQQETTILSDEDRPNDVQDTKKTLKEIDSDTEDSNSMNKNIATKPKGEKKSEPESSSSEEKSLSLNELDRQITENKLITDEEKDIQEWLAHNKEINSKRREKMNQLLLNMSHKKVIDVRYVVNEKGQYAKLVKFEGSDKYVMIRNESNGEKVASETQNSKWFQVDQSYVMTGKDATNIITTEPVSLQLSSSILSTDIAMSGSGALGNFLYKLVEGKDNINNISKNFARDAGSSVAITVLVSTMPLIAISLASVLGVKAINDLRKNKFIKSQRKAVIISDILARAGTKTAFAVGGAIVGQSLIPVPFLGAFIGGVVGGFTASALVSSYDTLIAKRVSMELFCFYSLYQLNHFHKWTNELMTRSQIQACEEEAKQFLDILKGVLSMKVSLSGFMHDLITKQKDIQDLMDEIYASIARKGLHEKVTKEFEERWKTLVAFGFHSYYYYLLFSQLDEMQNTHKITEKDKLEVMGSYEKIIDVEPVIEWLSPKISVFSSWRPLDRMILIVGDMLKNYKIVTLFNIKDPIAKDQVKHSEQKKHHSAETKPRLADISSQIPPKPVNETKSKY